MAKIKDDRYLLELYNYLKCTKKKHLSDFDFGVFDLSLVM